VRQVARRTLSANVTATLGVDVPAGATGERAALLVRSGLLCCDTSCIHCCGYCLPYSHCYARLFATFCPRSQTTISAPRWRWSACRPMTQLTCSRPTLTASLAGPPRWACVGIECVFKCVYEGVGGWVGGSGVQVVGVGAGACERLRVSVREGKRQQGRLSQPSGDLGTEGCGVLCAAQLYEHCGWARPNMCCCLGGVELACVCTFAADSGGAGGERSSSHH
jgi:hypothetical protein